MRNELKPIREAMMSVLQDARASRIERIECARVLLSCYGCLIPDVDERWLSVKQITQLRRAKQNIVERVLRQKAVRKKQNRRSYLRRTIKALEQQETNRSGTTATIN